VKIKSQKDFFSGLMFTVVGVAFAWGATTYSVGSGARMGPGYFPLMLGILMAVIGLGIMFSGLTVETTDGEKIGKWAWKQVVFILGANLAFGILLGGLPSIGVPAMGMIIAIYALVIISSLAGHEFKLPKRAGPGHRAGHRQLCGLHLGAQAADPGLADLHHRLRRKRSHGIV
jgi:hypothetical protein